MQGIRRLMSVAVIAAIKAFSEDFYSTNFICHIYYEKSDINEMKEDGNLPIKTRRTPIK